ncbi:thioredoxin [Pseudomonas phage PspYZU05]|uniref:Thioredoxin n=1 Tax=Pseudomonas phage PspYZU05 TaxID=1983556 RepID=A0A2U7NJL5_9CAUD|nr:thioredoxin [Pseudomonas phage PspYZU05]ASD52124.1 thioredoxin [Pseudomonas phage PspYZU05]
MSIVVYGFDPSVYRCVPCINAKRLLDAKRKEYKFISVAKESGPDGPVFDESVLDELESLLGRRTKISMPQIVINGVAIGGFTELQKHNWSK